MAAATRPPAAKYSGSAATWVRAGRPRRTSNRWEPPGRHRVAWAWVREVSGCEGPGRVRLCALCLFRCVVRRLIDMLARRESGGKRARVTRVHVHDVSSIDRIERGNRWDITLIKRPCFWSLLALARDRAVKIAAARRLWPCDGCFARLAFVGAMFRHSASAGGCWLCHKTAVR